MTPSCLSMLLVCQCIFQAGSFRVGPPMRGVNNGRARKEMLKLRSTTQSEASDVLIRNRRVEYGMANVDLSSKWFQLVQDEKVATTTTIPDPLDTDKTIAVRYGVRIHPRAADSFMEFVESQDIIVHPTVKAMNETLKDNSLQCRYDGNYVAQLQLVRTLRPPPSPGFDQTGKTTSTPPPYNSETDSFVTGDLRLQLRPRVATLSLPSLTTDWDIFHNISPSDVRGHFLLLPTINDPNNNWRGQGLTESDCRDLIHLTASVQPVGSLMVGFNSVGAGASQNHIHCHLWPSPPIPWIYKRPCHEADCDDHSHDHSHSHMVEEDEDTSTATTHKGWDCYAPSRVDSIYDFVDVMDGEDPLVEVSYLNYPCFCVQLSSNTREALSQAVWEVLACLGDAPHNVCMLNRPNDNDDGTTVDVFVFARSRERSPGICSATKAGASEMMGVFHCQNLEQLEELVKENDTPPMAQLLEDVSHVDPIALWETIKEKLEGMSME